MILKDDKDSIRVLLYSHYTTITGWAVLLKKTLHRVQNFDKEWKLMENQCPVEWSLCGKYCVYLGALVE